MKTAVVILNWNGKGFLEKFLPGLVSSLEGADAEVIVADNASCDGSVEMMNGKFPEVRTMVFSKNHGFTGGYNRALFQIDAEYYVLINSDIEVTQDWFSPLEKWMDTHPECGICAPKLRSYDRREYFEYAGAAGGCIDAFGYPFCRGRIMKRVEKDEGQYDTPKEVFWASGACLMIRSSLYRSLGGLDERFFAHMEEIDLCWRAKAEGRKVCIVPSSVVYHVGGGTLPNDSPKKLYLNFRNNLLMLGNNLAKTLAAELVQKGAGVEKSAKAGMRKARRRIASRMILDVCSAAVYLATLRPAYFKAVIEAHRDFRKMNRRPQRKAIMQYLEKDGGRADMTGIYRGWIVPVALLYGKKAFGKVGSETV